MATTKTTSEPVTDERDTRQRTKRPIATYDHLLKRKPTEIRELIPLDSDAVSTYEDTFAQQRMVELTGTDEEKVRLRRRVEAAKARLDETSVEVVFRSIGDKAYERLRLQYPPTEEQVAEAKAKLGAMGAYAVEFDRDSFAPALIAASAIEPKMSMVEVEALRDSWSRGEFEALFQAALRANTSRLTVDWGEGSSGMPG